MGPFTEYNIINVIIMNYCIVSSDNLIILERKILRISPLLYASLPSRKRLVSISILQRFIIQEEEKEEEWEKNLCAERFIQPFDL